METYNTRSRLDRVRFGAAALAAVLSCASPAAAAEQPPHDSRQVTVAEADKPRTYDWQVQWRDSFSGDALHDRWGVIDHKTYEYAKFQQYRDFNVRIKNDKLILLTRRHCVQPGEAMTLANAQVEPCAEGTETRYSSGRVQQAVPDIRADFRIQVKAKMPEAMQGRASIWMNNIDRTPGSMNEGYCIEGSTTPTAEIDLQESLADVAVRGAHHVHCEDGKLDKVTRKKSFPKGWLKKFHTYEVVREGRKTTLLVDGSAVPVSGTRGRQQVDRPRDFSETSTAEFDAAYAYDLGIIIDTETFPDQHAKSPLFRAPDPDKIFPVYAMKIDDVLVSNANQ